MLFLEKRELLVDLVLILEVALGLLDLVDLLLLVGEVALESRNEEGV